MIHVPLLALVLASACTATEPSFVVTAEFTDVLDLVPRAAVKVNDVTVGDVAGISLQGWHAVVRLRVQKSVRLPDNATAAIRQSSLLGEKFVALAAPPDPVGALSDGDLIPLTRTTRSAEVEEVLAALGMLLHGGGLANLKTINVEVAQALTGREEEARRVLSNLEKFVAGLDDQKADIVRAIEALDRLSARLAEQRQAIGEALAALDPGLTALAQQRQQLTAALKALDALAGVGTRVIDAGRADLTANLKALQPLLDQLVKAGDDLPRSLDFLLSFPFPPNATRAVAGNQVNLHLTLGLDSVTYLAQTLAAAPGQAPPALVPSVPLLPPLPQLPIPLPSLPPLPPLPLPSALPSLPVPLPIPSLPLPRILQRGLEP